MRFEGKIRKAKAEEEAEGRRGLALLLYFVS